MELDLSRVSADDFEADKFLRAALSGADQATVLRAIQDAKERASADLQRNVFRNYLSFVAISKDIAKLEDDMLVLRNLVQDLRSVAMESADEDYTDPAQDGPVRAKEFQDQAASSLASQTGRRQRSKNYFELVENLSRHLPPNPSRQTLREGSVVLDASAGSTRSAHPATLVLFTDALVVVSRKWPSVGAQKMTLEHCWGLTDVAVIDLKDGPDVTNTFKIIKHPDVFFCRFSTDDEKRSWLAAVKKATNDYLVARRAERESAAPAEKAEQRIAQPVAPEDVPARGTSLRVSTSKEAADPALSLAQWQWLSNLPDELDVWIAHREYDTATNESRRALDFFKSVGSDRAQLSDLRSKIQGRINELSTRIRRDLANPSSTKIVARRSIDLLCRLGQPERAREAFLKARESMIQHRVRQLNFDGDISAYISQLAIVFFTLLRNTCEWYNDAFKDPAMTSGTTLNGR
ncbi:Cullin repeat-like-containing domain protein [Hyaloraphidium curvatum]|nr:Cullin repeat-like-containing domain protein [Hyaloraphidium curvatum]